MVTGRRACRRVAASLPDKGVDKVSGLAFCLYDLEGVKWQDLTPTAALGPRPPRRKPIVDPAPIHAPHFGHNPTRRTPGEKSRLVLRSMPIGIAYAIWSGMGIVLVSVLSVLIYRQVPDTPAVFGMSLIIAGTVVINVFSSTVGH